MPQLVKQCLATGSRGGEAAIGGGQGQSGAGRCQAGPVALRQRLPGAVSQPGACSHAQVGSAPVLASWACKLKLS